MTDQADPRPTPPAAAYDRFVATGERLRSEVEQALVQILREGLERHREVRMSIGLDEDPPEDPDVRGDRLLEYRRVVTSELLDRITLHFEKRAPASQVAEAVTAAMHETVQAIGSLPEQVELAWDPDAMRRLETDGTVRAFAKSLGRLVRAGGGPGETRSVPIRAVTQRHVHDVLMPAVDAAALEASLGWAEWTRSLERAWVTWAEVTLELLMRSRRVEGEELATMWEGLRESTAALQASLEQLVADAPTGLADHVDGVVASARSRLEGDLRVAGSFVYSPTPLDSAEWSLPRLGRVQKALETLDVGVGSRLSLHATLLGVLAGATAVRARLLQRFQDECLGPIRTLSELADRLEGYRAEVPRTRDRAALHGALTSLRSRVGGELGPALDVIPEADTVREIMGEGGRAMGEAVNALVHQMPETLTLVPPDVTVHPRMRKVDTREVSLRVLARQAFDVLRVERIANTPLALGEAVERLHTDIDELERVFSYAFDSALDELTADESEDEAAGGDAGLEPAEAPIDPAEHATQLVSDALQNIADSLRGEVGEVEHAFESAGRTLSDELSAGALGLLERVGAGGVQAQVLAARSSLVAVWAWAAERWGPRLNRATRFGRYWWAQGRRLWRRGSRAGRRVLSGSPEEEAASTRLVRLLSEAAEMMRTLPPVYQRLFTLEPVEEPSLLIGREPALADAFARWRRLEHAEADCIVYRAHPGAGLTSFLLALEARVGAEGGRVARVAPSARVTDEAALAKILATAIGLEAQTDLDALAAAILAAEPGSLPGLVTIDDMEHLFLRAPGGADLIEATLSLMARTEDHICWVGAITISAWQQVEAALPTAVAMIDVAELPPLSPSEVRTAITTRHRRSGLPLRYQEPRGRRLLQRRLKRATSPEEAREILADDFFDQLTRTSTGDLRFALFQWLRCCDFDQGDGLLILPPSRPDYSALDSLSWTEAFTLKAFLDHRTLSLAEHDAIFRMPRQESAFIFESLVNRRLIRPVGAGPIDTSPTSESRFRIHGLLVGAVGRHLRGRNVVH